MRDAEQQNRVDELIDAVCGRGWDAAWTANRQRADELLTANPKLARGDFVAACATGEWDTVRQMLRTDPSLATRPLPPRGWEPLVYVAFSILVGGHDDRAQRIIAIARLLLEHGASANAHYIGADPQHSSFPVLYGSLVASDNLELAELLLQAGASPNDHQSLYHAAERPDTRALELLSKYGIDRDWLSYCLLHKIDFGDPEGIRWFLQHGADPNVSHPHSGEGALHWAIKRASSRAVIELLLSYGADPNRSTRDGRVVYPTILGYTALDVAERLGRTDLVDLLERHGAKRGPRDERDEFIMAAARGDESTAHALLSQSPRVMDCLDPADRNLVAHLAQSRSTRGATLLMRLGFSPSAGGWMGLTAPHWAAIRGNQAMLGELLAAGAPLVDIGSPFGSPLHTVLYQRWNRGLMPDVEGHYAGVVQQLLDAGVEVPPDPPPTGLAELDAMLSEHLGKRP